MTTIYSKIQVSSRSAATCYAIEQDYGDYSDVYDPTVGAQQSVVVPNCSNIQPVVNRVFNLGDAQSCNVTG